MNEKIKFARVLFLSVGEKGANKDTYYTCEVILKNLHKGYFIYSPLRKTENHHSLPLEGMYIYNSNIRSIKFTSLAAN